MGSVTGGLLAVKPQTRAHPSWFPGSPPESFLLFPLYWIILISFQACCAPSHLKNTPSLDLRHLFFLHFSVFLNGYNPFLHCFLQRGWIVNIRHCNSPHSLNFAKCFIRWSWYYSRWRTEVCMWRPFNYFDRYPYFLTFNSTAPWSTLDQGRPEDWGATSITKGEGQIE